MQILAKVIDEREQCFTTARLSPDSHLVWYNVVPHNRRKFLSLSPRCVETGAVVTASQNVHEYSIMGGLNSKFRMQQV